MIVHVKYRKKEGYHLFTSPEVPGLYCGSRNYRGSLADVPVVIRALVAHKRGVPEDAVKVARINDLTYFVQ